MSKNSNTSNVSRRKFLAVAGTVAAASSVAIGKDLGSFATPPLPSPVKYVVTISITNDQISYVVVPPIDPHNMNVNVNDEITWRCDTGPGPKHRVAIVFTKTTPFVDNYGAVYAFQWSEKDDANGGFGGGKALTQGTHEYCVAVFDDAKHRTFADDPKIIVGGSGDVKAEIREAKNELKAVMEKIESVENLLSKAVDQL